MKKILQTKEKILHQTAHEVPILDIKKVKIKKVLKEMSEALKSQSDGVAIAAPQIGYPLRIFVVSGKVLEMELIQRNLPSSDNTEKKSSVFKDLIFINPKISKLSRKKDWMSEGCLSVRPFYGKTFRSLKATITAYDENGKKLVRGASGLLAQIFQHEIDHLNGILFIDHAKDIKEELPPSK